MEPTRHIKELGARLQICLGLCARAIHFPLNHISSYEFIHFPIALDEISRRNLELVRSLRYGTKYGSLLSVIDQTITPMGSRLLQQWLLHPLLDIKDITFRQDIIQSCIDKSSHLKELRLILKEIGDITRLEPLLFKITHRTDCLKSYLYSARNLQNKLNTFEHPQFAVWNQNMGSFTDIIELIEKAINDNPPINITEGGIFAKNYNAELDELLELIHDGKSWIARLEDDERRKTGISNLKVGYNRVFGYYIEVSSANKNKVPDYYIAKQTLTNSERYISPRLKEFEAKVLSSEEKIKNLEYELFKDLRQQLAESLPRFQQLSEVIAELDVLSSLAFLAWQNQYSRPVFTENRNLHITDGRHPVIEKLIESDKFIPNDTYLDYPETSIALLQDPIWQVNQPI